MATFDKYLLKSEIRESSNKKITRLILLDLDFEEVLENRWLWLANPQVRTDGEIYVTFIKDPETGNEECYIEGNAMSGSARYGNHFVGIDGDLEKLLMIVELLNL